MLSGKNGSSEHALSGTRPGSRIAQRRFGLKTSRRPSPKIVVAILAAALVGSLATSALGARRVAGWFWLYGDSQTYIGAPSSGNYPPNSMVIEVTGDLDTVANHVRFVAQDGNYEFEHGAQTPYTLLNS